MNENKLKNRQSYSALVLKMEKNALNHDYKNNNRWNFKFTEFSIIDFFLTVKEVSVKQPKSAYGKSSSCRFSFSATRKAITKVTEYVTLGFSFRILVFPSRKV